MTAGISHGRLNVGNVLVVDDGPMLVDLSAATLGAPQSALDIDVAELLVACCVLVGPERALRKAVEAGWGDAVAPRAAVPAARGAHTASARPRALPRGRPQGSPVAAAAAAPAPEPPRSPRCAASGPKDVLLMAALDLRGLPAHQPARRRSASGRSRTSWARLNPAWVVVALILAQSRVRSGPGISVRGAVRDAARPSARASCSQSAIKFINLTVPSSAGRIGMNLRFLQQHGRAEPGRRWPAGAVDDVSETIVQAALFLIALPFVGVELDTSQFHGAGPDPRLLVGIAVALVVSAVVGPRRAEGCATGSCRSVKERSVGRLERGPGSATSGSSCSAGISLSELTYCDRAGSDLPRVRRSPEPGSARLRQHSSASVLSSVIPVARRYRRRRGAPRGWPHRDGSRRVDRVRDRHHAAPLHLLPPPIWGYVSLRWLTRMGTSK